MYFSLISNNKQQNKISSYILEEKKSKFIAYVFNISDELEAKQYIEKIKKENKDARHVVYIYSYLKDNNLPQINFCDDGEPQGTGTKAIYELITKEKITNVCIVIVRYFGGILLGAGPLSRAYLNSFRGALDKCTKQEIFNYIKKEISIEYKKYDILISSLRELINDKYVVITNTNYNEKITINFNIEERVINRVEELLLNLKY